MSLKQIFVDEFTKELILNSMPIQSKETLKTTITRKVAEKLVPSIINLNKKQEIKIEPQIENKNIEEDLEIPKPILKISQADYYQNLYLGKLVKILLDPSVTAVECPGPEKYVIIKKIGGSTASHIVLTKEEIEGILSSFSDKSKIPRIGGVFKAIVNNLVITAIDSDLSGYRFIISKMSAKPSQFL